MRIAREGWAVVATAAGVLGVVAVVGAAAGHLLAAVPLVLGVAFCLFFFRDPEREPPPGEDHLVSPADGRVLEVVPDERDEILDAPSTRLSIFMSPLDVHVNRVPVSGVVETVRHTPGKFGAAFGDKASRDNERNAMVLRRGGRRYVVVQVAGALARRIVCHSREGQALQRGDRYGLIMFGSRVDVYLPPDVRPTVKHGDRVRAGCTVVAEVPAGGTA
jgi:phosphatidylserine decarboxylase